MGRTSDRFGNRRHPLFLHAKELVTRAVYAAASSDASELVLLLDAKMDTLAARDFEDVMAMAYLELRQRKGAEQAIQVLVSTTQDVAEAFRRDSNGLDMSLFGLVLRLPAVASEVAAQLSQNQADSIVRALVQHRLLTDLGEVTLLPRLLTAGQTNGLLAGEVYALSRALGRGDTARAMALVGADAPPAPEAGTADRSSPADVIVVLVGVVGVRDGAAYPLPAEFAARLQPTDTPELQPMGYAFTSPEVLQELHRKLSALCSDLSPALGGGNVEAVQPAGAFAQVSIHAVNLERTAAALAVLTGLTQEPGTGQDDSLVVGRPVPAGADGFAVPVHRQSNGRQVGAIAWPQARYERPRDALLQLLTFLQDQQLLEEGLPRSGLLH